MGAVNFSIDLGLVAALKETLPLDVFVETGTFRGDTVELVKHIFREIRTVELSPEYYAEARSRFGGQAHIDLVYGDSAASLTEWAPSLRERSVLYFLDAHWCVAANTAGEASQCPLLGEIRAIGTLNANSLIVIDDARLFLAPPPAPHEISQWPSMNEVIRALLDASVTHIVMVLNDNIVFFPPQVESVVRAYGHAHGLDWLDALHKTRDYDNLRAQFEHLQRQLELKDIEIEELKEAAVEKDEEIGNLVDDCHERDEEIGKLLAVCDERLQLINFQAGALRTHYVWRLKNVVDRVVGRTRQTIAKALLPRLGVLNQYPPRPLNLSGRYGLPAVLSNPARISIVTPSFSQAVFLERTIRSVLEQNYPALEYIVQDGGSKDGSVEILQRHSDRLTFWESKPDEGQTNAINLGFRHASGEIMAYLNSDDLLLPGALAYVATYFEGHPEVDVVYSHRIIIDENDQEIGRWILPAHDNEVLTWADFIPQETLFWRRRAWDKIGASLDETFHFAMDWDLLLRFSDAGARFARLPVYLAAFRVHPQQKTSAQIGDTGSREMARLRQRCHGRDVGDDDIRRGVASYVARHVAVDLAYRIKTRIAGTR